MSGESLQQKLIAAEREIAAAAERDDLAALDQLIDDEFYEIGASGQRYDKKAVLDALVQMKVLEAKFDDFKVASLDESYAIVTYESFVRRIIEGKEQSSRHHRASLWINRGGTWRVLFHHVSNL